MFTPSPPTRDRPGSPILSDIGFSSGRQRLHALLVTDSLDPSGVGEHMVTLARALRDQVDVVLIFPATPEAAIWIRRAHDYQLAVDAVPASALNGHTAGLQSLLAKYRPDLVHVHAGIGWEGHAIAAAAREWGAPAVVRTEHLPYTLRELKNPKLETAYAQGVQSVDRIICVCEAARRTFRMSGVSASRFTVVRNGIYTKSPVSTREEVRAELGIREAPLILTVARFTEQKRHITLLSALPRLLACNPDVCLAWVGTGPLESALRERVATLGVTDKVLFLGHRSDVPDLLAAADVFCLPSYFEGHPLVALEAMAAGLPVVAARSLGITEAVTHEVTGLLFRFDSALLLAHALNRVLGDPALACRLGEAGRAAFHQDFSAERMGQETLAVYQDVLNHKGALSLHAPLLLL